MKSASLWDKNQGSLNGIRGQKGWAKKKQAHVPDYKNKHFYCQTTTLARGEQNTSDKQIIFFE